MNIHRCLHIAIPSLAAIFYLAAIEGRMLSMALQQQPREDPAEIAGVVLDATTGNGIPNVRVAFRGSGQSREALTDQNGRYALTDLPPGRGQIVFRAFGYAPWRSSYSFTPGVAFSDATTLLDPTGIIAGRLIDSSGSPMVRASITLLGHQTAPDGYEDLLTRTVLRSDDRGQFRITEVPAGAYFLAVVPNREGEDWTGSLPAYLYPAAARIDQARSVIVNAGETLFLGDVAMPGVRIGRIALSVDNPDVAAYSNIQLLCCFHSTLTFDGQFGGYQEGPADQLVFESTGRVTRDLWPLLPGMVRATLSWNDRSGAYEQIYLDIPFDGSDLSIMASIRLPPGQIRIRSEQQTESGAISLGGVSVHLGRPPLVGAGDRGVLPRPDRSVVITAGGDGVGLRDGIPLGRYPIQRVSGLPDGYYLERVTQNGVDALAEGILVSEMTEEIILTVRPGTATIFGDVLHGGAAAHDALVALLPDPDVDAQSQLLSLRAIARADQYGQFSFTNVAPGAYRLHVAGARRHAPTPSPDYLHLGAGVADAFDDSGIALIVRAGETLTVSTVIPERP